jgi:hypothetical protein
MKLSKLLLAILIIIPGISAVQAQTADEIISKHITATGGKEAWDKVNSIKMEGSLDVQGTEVTIVVTKLQNKGMRQDITAMGMVGYKIVTPAYGTTFMPFQGQTSAVPMTQDELKASQDQLDTRGLLLDYKEKGHSVALAGKETIDGVECFKLAAVLKSGKKESLFIDSRTYYVVRTVTSIPGQDAEAIIGFSNFKKLAEGIVFPFTITQATGELNLIKIEINKPVDEAIFKAD